MYALFDEDYVDSDLPEMKRVYLEGKIGFANAFGAGWRRQGGLPVVPA
jgi:hypothetical protein